MNVSIGDPIITDKIKIVLSDSWLIALNSPPIKVNIVEDKYESNAPNRKEPE